MIDIKYGKEGSDCTAPYYITTDNKTVREFISEWLNTYPHEWGYFTFLTDSVKYFDAPRFEYEFSKLLNSIPDELLDCTIKKVSGSGGWSNSDIDFSV